MKFGEEVKDLFSVSNDYFLAHCISADAKMGAGIAVKFKRRFKLWEFQKVAQETGLKVGSCAMVGRVLNLITKECYWHKPTYLTFRAALVNMKKIALKHEIDKIAMPQIGAGLDRLDWEKNKEIIQDVFKDTDVEILVCKLK
ncbi:macro domain-containing protein [Alkalihalophilus pseudofirmus]|uniref:macro domain-containing protein n=1 Tax=Alkalihalophilus pseudofirmus TaxID=79885 RepID=UPI00259B5D69|nr:macro domain-containing protein [Alkalihalophilus pseudofirmus]WEG18608.1 macro domain-containing protein [Alkalihalophilus pseudofirmus]